MERVAKNLLLGKVNSFFDDRSDLVGMTVGEDHGPTADDFAYIFERWVTQAPEQ